MLDVVRNASDVSGEETRQSELAAINEQLSVACLEMDEPDSASQWIESALVHLSGADRLTREGNQCRLQVYLSTCLNHAHRFDEAEAAARHGIVLAKPASNDLCLAHYELGNALLPDPARLKEAVANLQMAASLARQRGAALRPVQLDAEAKLAQLRSQVRSI